MPNVIDFLEKMGQDAHLRYAKGDELASALIKAGIDPSLQDSVLNAGGQNGLEILLGAKPNVCCGIAPATYDEDDVMHPSDTTISRRAATL